MTKNETALIKKALFAVAMQEVKLMDSFPEVDLPHSEEYLSSIVTISCQVRIIKDKKHSLKKKLLIGLVAALLVILTACAFSKPIINFVEKTYTKFTEFFAADSENSKIEAIYMPEYIPEGYKIATISKGETTYDVTWSNGEHKIIYFQRPLNNESIVVDTENAEHGTYYIGEQSVYYTYKNNVYLYVWENDVYSFQLRCSDTIPREEVEKIILSIQEQPVKSPDGN